MWRSVATNVELRWMRRSDFRDLQVWQKARILCVALYRATCGFPSEEKFGVVLQIRRAAISVPSNIAEGHGRSSKEDFRRFLFMSLGSLRELESLIEISSDLDYLEDGTGLILQIQEVAKMLTALIASTQS